jgi:hypothetical protein
MTFDSNVHAHTMAERCEQAIMDERTAVAEVERLRQALEWYANPEIYQPHPHGIAFDRRDLSFKARCALDRQ